MKNNPAARAPFSDQLSVLSKYGDYVFTKTGTLLGALELHGRDPDGLIGADHAGLSIIARAIYSVIPRNITVSQYYCHYQGEKVSLRGRKDPVSELITRRRQNYLNTRIHSASRLIHYIEAEPFEDLNKLKATGFIKHILSAAFSGESRNILGNYLSPVKNYLVSLEELERQYSTLSDTLSGTAGRWTGLMDSKTLSAKDLWANMRFLATLRPELLRSALGEEMPEEDWDFNLSDGDLEHINVLGMSALKINGPVPVYLRIAAIKRLGSPRIIPGAWAKESTSPARLPGNYIIMNRWTPLNEIQRSLLFKGKETELQRETLSIIRLITGRAETEGILEKQAYLKPGIKAKLDELGQAESLNEVWGSGHSFVLAFSEDPYQLKETCLAIDRSVTTSGMSLMWESVDLPGAFRTFQPGGRQHSIRDMRMTSMQMGATSLIYQSAIGQPRVADLGGEEALYILETVDGQLFHYSPFVGGRGMVICVGPIRSGKTFFKNCLASHTLKYGGLYRAMDIDPGTETVAKALGDKAGIFRVDKTPGSGFNPFASYRGEGDHQFVAHITDLALEMMRANDDPRLQTLDKNEQSHLDAAVRKVLRLPQQMQNLRTLVAHMPSALKQKFIRWIRASEVGGHGRYAFLLDEDKDSIGALDTPFAVFNLQGIKADLKAMRPIQLELLYRITQAFEDPALRGVPKTLDIDEAHFPLGIPAFSEYIVEKIRTWGKFMGSVQLWTQSPEELGKVSGWSALRSAASTFIFMADPKMDEQLYIDTFKISLGECEAIRNLIPRREAYIIQPELGVSKKVILNTEPEQYALNTSHPREAALRDRLIETHGFQEGIKRFLEAKDRLENPAIQQDTESSTRQLHVA